VTAHRVPLVVIGAGPAGVAAALAAVEARVPVVLVDLGERPGGQQHRREATAFTATSPGALHPGWDRWQDDLGRLTRSPRITLLTATAVWSARRRVDGVIELATDRVDLPTLEADAVIVATGAHERVVPFPGWDLPGVLTIGAAQALVNGQGVRPGHRVVVAGSGPILLPAASTLVRVGTGIVALADAGDPTRFLRQGPRNALVGLSAATMRETAEHLATLARHRVRLRTRTAAIEARGDGRVEEVVLARVDADWCPVTGTEEVVAADALATSHGYLPDVALALALGAALDPTADPAAPAVRVDALQATGVPGVWAAGEPTGIGGAEVAEHEGTVAGLAAARALGGRVDEGDLEAAVGRRRADEPFVRRLQLLLQVPSGALSWLRPDTVICRCEEVTLSRIDAAITHRSACDLGSIMATTRCGTGACQGRVCAPAVSAIVMARIGAAPPDAGAMSRRPVLHPVRLGDL
jgi:D-hydroxyproline dehydrogenase subunit alpha